ncbi:MAG: hypothetical protein V1777_01205 [Candidatus Micrarchaeota archaeon]
MESKTIAVLAILGVIVIVGGIMVSESTNSQPWNVFRPVENFSVSLAMITTILVLVLSAGMFVVSLKAYAKNNTSRFLLLTLAFGLFAAKFLIKLIDFFYSPGNFFSQASENVFDLFVLVALFASLLKKE